jgi:hypothetical protein
VLSKRQAGATYLRLVKPANLASARLRRYVTHHNTITAKYLADVRRIGKVNADANRQFSLDLLAQSWPTDLRPTVRQLVREVTADQAGLRAISKARTGQDILDGLAKLAKDKGSAELLRQQLGLPERKS